MIAIIEKNLSRIVELCRQHHICRLELFGSATRDDFDPATSDLDFLVEFAEIAPGERFSSFFNFQRALSELLGRPVDLVEPGAMSNPYFIRRVNENRRLVYAA